MVGLGALSGKEEFGGWRGLYGTGDHTSSIGVLKVTPLSLTYNTMKESVHYMSKKPNQGTNQQTTIKHQTFARKNKSVVWERNNGRDR